MADWVDIDNETIEPDAPLISSTMFALRDNPKAIAEGAAGAPRVVDAAIAADSLDAGKTLAVSAGDVIRFRDDAQRSTQSSSFQTVVDEHLLTPGSIRVTFEIEVSSGTSTSRVLVNGSVAQEFVVSSTSYVERSVDVNIERNDRIRVQHQAGGANTVLIRNIRFRTSGGRLWPGRAGYVY